MNILSSCLRRLSHPPAPAAHVGPTTPALPVLADEATAAGDAGLAPGCGWFDSSWTLQQGLAVQELPDSDLPVAALWFSALAGVDVPTLPSMRLQ